MPSFSDQTGRSILLNEIPRRIVSIVPSQTELLYDLGLNEEVVGITKFCVHPEEWFRNKTRVGGTKQLRLSIIRALKTDLVIANKEENVKEQVEELSRHFPVWTSDVNNLEDAYDMITQVGMMTGRNENAEELIAQIKQNFSRLPTLPTGRQAPGSLLPAAYFIWQKPYMTVGGDTFIHSMMRAAGFDNLFANRTRYPEVTIDELNKTGCQVLLLSSEPFPFKQKHIEELQPQLPNTRIILVDGEMFSWYGSRLLKAPPYFLQIRKTLDQ